MGRNTSCLRSPQCLSFGTYTFVHSIPCVVEPEPDAHLSSPRGWHLNEARVTVDNKPISASLFDFALYFYHNAKELIARGSGPYFYLPKMEHYLEARLWNDVFLFSQSYIGIPHNTIRATVLIETLPAAFQMEEILFELRNHSSGLNCGRWVRVFLIVLRSFSTEIVCLGLYLLLHQEEEGGPRRGFT